MKKKLLTLLLLVLTISAWADWLPSKYARWVPEWKVDQMWQFADDGGTWNGGLNNGNNTSTVEAPGFISFNIYSWHNRDNTGDDHSLDWCYVTLINNANTNDLIDIARIAFTGDGNGRAWEDEYAHEGSAWRIDDFNGCTTHYVQKRMDTQYDGGTQYCYFVTKYSDQLRNFVNRVGSNLRLRIYCSWDGGRWHEYREMTSDNGFWTSGGGFKAKPTTPSATNFSWVNQDGKTALQFTYSGASSDLYSLVHFYNGAAFVARFHENVKNLGDGEKTVVLSEKCQLSADLVSSPNLKLGMHSHRAYNYSHAHFRGGHGCPSSSLYYSETVWPAVPQMMIPKKRQFSAGENGDGTITLRWNIDRPTASSYDRSAFVLERADDAAFTTNVVTTEIAYDSKVTTYTYTDSYDQRQMGRKTFYYRLRRAHSGNDLAITTSASVETNYAQLVNVEATTTADGKAHVTWDIVRQGIWNSDMEFVVSAGNILSSVLKSDVRSVDLAGVPTCEETSVTVSMRERSMEIAVGSCPYTRPDNTPSRIDTLTASKGFYADRVELRWTIDRNADNFALYNVERINRKDVASDQWTQLGTVSHIGGSYNYNYQDNTCVAGEYYYYRVTGFVVCGGNQRMGASKQVIGFAQPYGVVSGQVNYSGNQAVEGVKISAIGEGTRSGSSLHFVKPDTIVAMHDSLVGYTKYPKQIDNPLRNTDRGTVEMWVKGDWDSNYDQYLLSTPNGDGGVHMKNDAALLFIHFHSSNRTSRDYWWPGYRTQNAYLNRDGTHWKQGDWNLITLTYITEGSTYDLRLYINGEEQANYVRTGETNCRSLWRDVASFYVGAADASNSWPYKGKIREIRMWDVARTAAEVNNNMNANYSSTGGNLVYLYKAEPIYQTVEGSYDNSYVTLAAASANEVFGAKYGSAEMWIRPDRIRAAGAQTILHREGCYDWSITADGEMRFTLSSLNKGTDYSVGINLTDSATDFTPAHFNHVAVSYGVSDAGLLTMQLLVNGSAIARRTYQVGQNAEVCNTNSSAPMMMGADGAHFFSGYMDEIRLWNCFRDSAAVAKSMDGYLSGDETGLTGYYRCDQENTGELYDLSKTNYQFNQRHAVMTRMSHDQNIVPNSDQLSLSTRTDARGNYILSAIPYTESGSLYTIIPTMGVHEFSPSQRPLYFNKSTSTHNSINFTDESSFTVSGYVLFDNTDYPVEGCNFYVDGVACTKNQQLIESDKNGYYEISVPIGEHYIEVRKEGHSFADGGRYPTAVAGMTTTFNFQTDITRLDWSDVTRVTLTGRVAGGNAQEELPHGMQLGKNNIGTARIVISPVTKEKYDLNLRDSMLTYAAPDSCMVQSVATTAARGGMAARRVVITTDSVTGEFSVQLPPIDMSVDSISVGTNDAIYFNTASFGTLALSKCEEGRLQADSIMRSDSTCQYFRYTAKLDAIYRVNPTLLVEQANREDGLYGIDSTLVTDPLNLDTAYTVRIIDKNSETQQNEYKYACPFYLQGNTYAYNLLCYERYTNYDGAEARIDTVPVSNSQVSISNSIGEPINGSSNSFSLDSLGRGQYVFAAGEPNTAQASDSTEAYRLYWSILYTDSKGDMYYSWDGNKTSDAVVLGSQAIEGTNFITEGPDELVYILRDPSGSGSTATLAKGTTITSTTTESKDIFLGTKSTLTYLMGAETTVGTGIGLTVITTTKVDDKLSVTYENEGHFVNSKTTTKTLTTTETISTSSGSKYVGRNGDVYIGLSRNMNFSDVNTLWFHRNPTTGAFYLDMETGIAVGSTYKTDFALSQRDMEEVQIPTILSQRNALLLTVSQNEYDNVADSTWQRRVADKEHYTYITPLASSDPNFGELGTYRAIPPTAASAQDMVTYYNTQLASWKKWFSYNEETKVKAIDNLVKCTKENYTLDAGAKRSFSTTNDSTGTSTYSTSAKNNFAIKNKTGLAIVGIGFNLEQNANAGWQTNNSSSETEKNTTTVSYAFDLNQYEQLSVNVYKGADAYGPVFSTVAGQTYCPYEGVDTTRYYEPGQHTLSTATQRMENPKITVEVPEVSGIPAGGHAVYTVHLKNEVATTTPRNLQLSLDNTTNPHGAQVFCNGAPLSNGTVDFWMEPNQEYTVTIELKQTDLEVLDYENVLLYFSSECGFFTTYATAPISAHFTASCPEVDMAVNRTITNMEDPTVLFRLTNYDASISTFQKLRLEYKKTTDANFLYQIAEIEKDTLQKTAVYTYRWDMSDLVDGLYEARVVAVCRLGNEEVVYEGSPVTITKDCAIPEALGLPSPINGIYTNDNEVYVTFNEAINTALIKPTDIEVTGPMNGGEVVTDISYRLPVTGFYAGETEAAYILKNTSFSMECWMRIDSVDWMDFIAHNSNFSIGINEEGKLMVHYYTSDGTLCGDTSKIALPLNRWFYLCVQQELLTDSTQAILHAHYALDDKDITLMNKNVPAYSGTGPMQLGINGQADISLCELQLWNDYCEWPTILSTIYETKELYRTNLYGYWPLHDGEGETAKELMRSRNMVLAGDSWRYADENMGIRIPAGTYTAVPIGDKQIIGQDYAIEFWFRRSEPGVLYAVLASEDTTYVVLNETGLEWRWGNVVRHQALYTNYCDGTWHHFALIRRTQSDNELLIDGTPCLTLGSAVSNDWRGRLLIFGGDHTTLDIDEVRLWKATLTPDWISDNRRNRIEPTATGLILYYPMDSATPNDMSGDTLYSKVPMTSGIDSIPFVLLSDAPAMVVKKNATTIPHTYTASETKLVINITAKPSQIEGQMLNFHVAGLPDTHNNFSRDIRWSAYVHRNLLEWDAQDLTITKEVLDSKQIAVTFTNRSGNIESWTISGLPDWMSVSEQSGSLAQLMTKTVYLTIDESLAIGHYETTIYLSGNQGIYDPLPMTIQVTGDRPDWSVDPAQFEHSMNIIGQIYSEGSVQVDTADMLAVKIGNTLVGLAQPMLLSAESAPYVMLDVYYTLTNQELANIAHGRSKGPQLSFEYWDASTGLIYTDFPVKMFSADWEKNDTTLYFTDGRIYGSIDNPVYFEIENIVRQQIDIANGWNWYSFNVLPLNDTANVFLKPLLPYISLVKTQDSYAELDSVRQQLVGSLDCIDLRKMYRVRSLIETSECLTGYTLNPATIPYEIKPGWTWIGYTPNMTLSVNAAMANMNPMTGDVVKGQRGFATYYNEQWVGSLHAMTPGAGYMYYSTREDSVTFYYPSQSAILLSAPARIRAEQTDNHYSPVDRSHYSGNMTVTAIVMNGGMVVPASGLEVAVFAGEECRTTMQASDDRFFLTVPGDDVTTLQFRVWDGLKEYVVEETILFVNDAQYGSYNEPYVIQIGKQTGLDENEDVNDNLQKVIINEVVYIIKNGRWYNILGQRVSKPQ